jgi:ubiquinone/menaquinone biosynthesis C-methylase UbiE
MSFDRLAPHYRWMEAALAGGLLQRGRTRWLPEVHTAKRALLAGEGNGRFLERCAHELPHCHLTVVDESAAMLAQARRRWLLAGGTGRIDFQRADLRAWRWDGEGFDLVVTNFFLDCFSPAELSRVVHNLSAATSSKAYWLLTDFTVPPSGWPRTRARVLLGLAYSFFRVATGISARHITAPDEALRTAGLQLQRREFFNSGLLHADLWQRQS